MAICCALLASWVILVIVNANAEPATSLGIQDGRFSACPKSPNCVSTMSADEEHLMQPISFKGSVDAAMERVKALVAANGWKIVSEERDYLHSVATTTLLRFIDDVEFYFDTEAQLLHFRSASRLGYSDLGENRRRMQKFRKQFGSAVN
jgi:uncharacterized protein (DUF1499 family)